MLDYQTAKNAAKRLLFQNDIDLKHASTSRRSAEVETCVRRIYNV